MQDTNDWGRFVRLAAMDVARGRDWRGGEGKKLRVESEELSLNSSVGFFPDAAFAA